MIEEMVYAESFDEYMERATTEASKRPNLVLLKKPSKS